MLTNFKRFTIFLLFYSSPSYFPVHFLNFKDVDYFSKFNVPLQINSAPAIDTFEAHNRERSPIAQLKTRLRNSFGVLLNTISSIYLNRLRLPCILCCTKLPCFKLCFPRNTSDHTGLTLCLVSYIFDTFRLVLHMLLRIRELNISL